MTIDASRWVRIAALASASWASALVVTAARANGRFPAANALVFSETDARQVILRTTFGLLISHDGGTSWEWICEDALGVPPTSTEDPSVAITASGTMIVGLLEGLETSSDWGCTWRAPDVVGGQRIADLTVRPNASHRVLALAAGTLTTEAPDGSSPVPAPADASGYGWRAFESKDDGASWSALGPPLDPGVVPLSLEVATSDPQRLYVSVARGDGVARTAALFVSLDRGASWVVRPIPLDPESEGGFYIAAVDPADADRVFLRSQGRSRLLVTGDAGKTYVAAIAFAGPMLGFALTPDASRIYVGGPEDGVWTSSWTSTAGFSFVRSSALAAECLAAPYVGTLWACAPASSGFIAGFSSDDGAHFSARLKLNGVRHPLTCPADTRGAKCAGEFDQLCATLPGCTASAGVPDDSGGSGGAAAMQATGSSAGDAGLEEEAGRQSAGCSTVVGGAGAGLVAGATLVGAGAVLRRRRLKGPGS
jgi:hypothetical protein